MNEQDGGGVSGQPPRGFWRTAGRQPEQVVVVDARGRRWSAGEMLAGANRLVRTLRARGVKPGSVMAVALGDSAEFLQLCLASLQSGWYFAPLNPRFARAEIAAVLEDAEPALLIYDEMSAPNVREAASGAGYSGLVSLDALWKEAKSFSGSTPDHRRAGALLAFTSGTTGKPRAITRPLPQDAPERLGRFAAVHLNAVCGIKPQSGAVHLVASPLYHSASLLWCLDHLHLGHRVVLAGRWDSFRILRLIQNERVTGALMVPTHFHRLLRLPTDAREGFDLSSLRHVVHTGAPCPPSVKRRMLDWWGPVIYEVYGAAEGAGTRATPQEWLARPGTVGKSFGRIRILQDDFSECPPGVVGTVYIKSGTRKFDYKGASEASLREGYFTVQDLGRLDEDGFLYLHGRRDEVLICGGVNVYPAEIEAVLASHPRVGDAVVTGYPDAEYGERVWAVVEPLEGDTTGLPRALWEFCRERLSGPRRPARISLVKGLPRNETGKLSRPDLRDLLEGHGPPSRDLDTYGTFEGAEE